MANSEINMMVMMKECMKACQWCAVFPVTFGVVLFLLGYFLDAEVVRILWLVFSGFVVLMGVFMFIMVRLFFR